MCFTVAEMCCLVSITSTGLVTLSVDLLNHFWVAVVHIRMIVTFSELDNFNYKSVRVNERWISCCVAVMRWWHSPLLKRMQLTYTGVPEHSQRPSRENIKSCQKHSLYHRTIFFPGRDGIVGIATRYGLVGPGIESWWGWDFSQPSRPTLGPTHPPVQ